MISERARRKVVEVAPPGLPFGDRAERPGRVTMPASVSDACSFRMPRDSLGSASPHQPEYGTSCKRPGRAPPFSRSVCRGRDQGERSGARLTRRFGRRIEVIERYVEGRSRPSTGAMPVAAVGIGGRLAMNGINASGTRTEGRVMS